MIRYFLVLLVLLAGCDLLGGDDDPKRRSGLDAGTELVYLASASEIDTAGQATLIYEDDVTLRVLATDARLESLRGLTHLTVRMKSQPDSLFAEYWYRETDAALVEIGYRLPGYSPWVMPKRGLPALAWSLLPRTPADATTDDEPTLRPDPRLVYDYPLEAGKQWTAFTEPFRQTRRVVGTETVTVAAGTFACLKIETRLPEIQPELVIYDYVADVGLVLRTTETPLLNIADPGNLDRRGRFQERFELKRRRR